MHYRRWRLDAALRSWKGTDSLLRSSPNLTEQQFDYDMAISVALMHLQRFDSIEALVTHHCEDRGWGAWQGTHWLRHGAPAGSLEESLLAAMRVVPAERRLYLLRVEEAAFWRRYLQLIAARITEE